MRYNEKFVSKKDIKICRDNVNGVDIRYSLEIPFKNRDEGGAVGIILMNPSKADKEISDSTINKIINFFYNSNEKVGQITICNLIPVYGTKSTDIQNNLVKLSKNNKLYSVQCENRNKIVEIMDDKDYIILAWGKPSAKTVSNLFYYKQASLTVDMLEESHKEKLRVFKMKGSSYMFTDNGDPRHPARTSISKIEKVEIDELYLSKTID